MKKAAMMILAASALIALTGCKEDQPKAETETVRSVEWFKEHKAERKTQLNECKKNPGELAATPNCVNASRADSSSTWESRGGGIKTPAPLTAEDINKN